MRNNIAWNPATNFFFLPAIGFLLSCLLLLPADILAAESDSASSVVVEKIDGAVILEVRGAPAKATTGVPSRSQILEKATSFLRENQAALGMRSSDSSLKVVSVNTDKSGSSRVQLQQMHRGLPVYGGEVRVLSDQSGEVSMVRARLGQKLPQNTKHRVTRNRAGQIALASVARATGKSDQFKVRTAEEMILPSYVSFGRVAPSSTRHVWKIIVSNQKRFGNIAKELYISAASGKVISSLDMVRQDVPLNRGAWDCSFSIPGNADYHDDFCWAQLSVNDGAGPWPEDPYDSTYQYTFGRLEGDPVRGPNPRNAISMFVQPWSRNDTDDLYSLFEIVDFYLMNEFQFDGANNRGGLAVPYPAYGIDYTQTNGLTFLEPESMSTPYWNADFLLETGDLRMGSGMVVPDVVGHESTHGILHHMALDDGYSSTLYSGETGAMEESFCDVFGEGVEESINGAGNWIHRTMDAHPLWHDVFTGPNRNLLSPAALSYVVGSVTKPYPTHLYDLNMYCGTQDNGGVHYNSTVTSHAFALIARGGVFNGCEVVPQGTDVAVSVFFKAWKDYFLRTETYSQAYQAFGSACNSLYSAEVCKHVTRALQAVELNQPGRCRNSSGSLRVTPACAAVLAGNVSVSRPDLSVPTYFAPAEHVVATGSGWNAGSTVKVVLAEATEPRLPLSLITPYQGVQMDVAVAADGTFSLPLWTASAEGAYEIVVDRSGNGVFEANEDRVISLTVSYPQSGDGQCYLGESYETSENCNVAPVDCACPNNLVCALSLTTGHYECARRGKPDLRVPAISPVDMP